MGCSTSTMTETIDAHPIASRGPSPAKEMPARKLYQLKEVHEGSPLNGPPTPENEEEGQLDPSSHATKAGNNDNSLVKTSSRPTSATSVHSNEFKLKLTDLSSLQSLDSSQKSSVILSARTLSLRSSSPLKNKRPKSTSAISRNSSAKSKHSSARSNRSQNSNEKRKSNEIFTINSPSSETSKKKNENLESKTKNISNNPDGTKFETFSTQDLKKNTPQKSIQFSRENESPQTEITLPEERKDTNTKTNLEKEDTTNHNKANTDTTENELHANIDRTIETGKESGKPSLSAQESVSRDEQGSDQPTNESNEPSLSAQESVSRDEQGSDQPTDGLKDFRINGKVHPKLIGGINGVHITNSRLQEHNAQSISETEFSTLQGVGVGSSKEEGDSTLPHLENNTKNIDFPPAVYDSRRNSSKGSISGLSDDESDEDLPCSLAASSSGLVLPRPFTCRRKERINHSRKSSSSINSNSSSIIEENAETNKVDISCNNGLQNEGNAIVGISNIFTLTKENKIETFDLNHHTSEFVSTADNSLSSDTNGNNDTNNSPQSKSNSVQDIKELTEASLELNNDLDTVGLLNNKNSILNSSSLSPKNITFEMSEEAQILVAETENDLTNSKIISNEEMENEKSILRKENSKTLVKFIRFDLPDSNDEFEVNKSDHEGNDHKTEGQEKATELSNLNTASLNVFKEFQTEVITEEAFSSEKIESAANESLENQSVEIPSKDDTNIPLDSLMRDSSERNVEQASGTVQEIIKKETIDGDEITLTEPKEDNETMVYNVEQTILKEDSYTEKSIITNEEDITTLIDSMEEIIQKEAISSEEAITTNPKEDITSAIDNAEEIIPKETIYSENAIATIPEEDITSAVDTAEEIIPKVTIYSEEAIATNSEVDISSAVDTAGEIIPKETGYSEKIIATTPEEDITSTVATTEQIIPKETIYSEKTTTTNQEEDITSAVDTAGEIIPKKIVCNEENVAIVQNEITTLVANVDEIHSNESIFSENSTLLDQDQNNLTLLTSEEEIISNQNIFSEETTETNSEEKITTVINNEEQIISEEELSMVANLIMENITENVIAYTDDSLSLEFGNNQENSSSAKIVENASSNETGMVNTGHETLENNEEIILEISEENNSNNTISEEMETITQNKEETNEYDTISKPIEENVSETSGNICITSEENNENEIIENGNDDLHIIQENNLTISDQSYQTENLKDENKTKEITPQECDKTELIQHENETTEIISEENNDVESNDGEENVPKSEENSTSDIIPNINDTTFVIKKNNETELISTEYNSTENNEITEPNYTIETTSKENGCEISKEENNNDETFLENKVKERKHKKRSAYSRGNSENLAIKLTEVSSLNGLELKCIGRIVASADRNSSRASNRSTKSAQPVLGF